MKKIIKYICCIIFICIFALLIYFGYKAYKVIFTPRSYTITVDTRLTHLAYQQIDAFIGKDRIPFETYRLIMNEKLFFDIPKIIEIPAQTLDDYKEVYAILIDFLTHPIKVFMG